MKNILKLTILAVFLVLVTSIAVSASTKLPFTDVPEDAWYYDTVAEAYEKGIMKGQSETQFAPTKTMSRAEFATLLYRLAGVNGTGFGENLASFADGVTDAWYSEAMGWAVERGLIKGMTDNTVRPNQTITRAEIAVMIIRYLDHMGYDLPEAAEESKFTDDAAIADWCREQIYTCQVYGIFKGDDSGRFNPSNNASRAEGATISLRLTKSMDEQLKGGGVTIATVGEEFSYTVLFRFGKNDVDTELFKIKLQAELKTEVTTKNYSAKYVDSGNTIVFGADNDPDCKALTETLGEDDYAIKLIRNGEFTKLVIAYTSDFSRSYAIEKLFGEFMNGDKLIVPECEIKETVKAEDFFITIDSITKNSRDPAVIVVDGVYYAYTTGWRVYKNTSGKLDGEWTEVKNVVEKPADYKSNSWAPEVHKYNGSYYMFTTYTPTGSDNGFENHGCIIMKSDSPEGPFKMITDGWITPKEWDCIDGTLYVDADGQPWMIFTHEHTSLNGNGSFMAAKLSDDLTKFISEPFDLFYAKDAGWVSQGITDGCFMYTTEDGQLLMLWSNFDRYGDTYALAVARSANGKLDGEWTHDDPLLFSKTQTGIASGGGHGMIFTDVDGQMYISFHSPNTNTDDVKSKITFMPVTERNGLLVWDVK
ncbi:MAG: family 43 glycosylhydrolase [Clostridia bacterium]|nr:family 43 glycosylhydrolase [Clostridia bacterium]